MADLSFLCSRITNSDGSVRFWTPWNSVHLEAHLPPIWLRSPDWPWHKALVLMHLPSLYNCIRRSVRYVHHCCCCFWSQCCRSRRCWCCFCPSTGVTAAGYFARMRVMLRFDLQVNLALAEQSERLILFYFLGDFIFWVRLWFLEKIHRQADKHWTCRNPYFHMLVIVFRWCLMIFLWQILFAHRYTNTQIGVPAFSPLMHASSLK